jgi:5-formyltetrahydrofolate cyclo-ligase
MKASRIEVQKTHLRRQLRQRLDRLTKAERQRKSQRILTRLMKTRDYLKAARIFTYIALPKEVQTQEFIQKSLALRKRVFVPAIHPRKKEISIFEIWNTKKDLKKGHFGIPEPVKKRPGRPEKLDLVIVPGLGFDGKGGRLGRGEGYFDRFLLRTGKARKIGLAFREQVVRKIPVTPHDVPVDRLITD